MINTSVSAAMMEQSIGALWQRGQMVTNNIANEETPGYKAKRTEFESLLRKEMTKRTSVTAFGKQDQITRIQSVQPKVYEDTASIGRIDGNNVDINVENIELARIQIQMDALTQKINGHYTLMRYAVTGGR